MENKDSSNKENQPVAKETYDNIPDYDNLQGSDSSDEEILYRDDDDDSPGKTPFSFTYELDLFRLFVLMLRLCCSKHKGVKIHLNPVMLVFIG